MAVTFLTDADRAELERMISKHTGGAVTIESIHSSTEDGGSNIITFSDGNKLIIKNGNTGLSATHSWNGTVLTVTSASGTSSADLKGAKGDKGDRGATGATGPSAQIDNISEGVDKEGTRYQFLTFSDGTPILIYDGKAGKDGKSAYAYAVDGGYEGTEEEFANLLANGFLESGVYELINTITLEGGESAVDITEDSAANVFALKAAFVKVETPASTDVGTGYIETYYGNQRISKHHISNIKQSSSTKISKAEVMQRYGRWAEYTYGGAADGATANLINIVQFTNETTTMDCKYVDKVRVRVNNVTFDAGTKITVWGVRI